MTVDELPSVSGSVGEFIRWNNNQNASGCLSTVNKSNKFPSAANENAINSNITIAFGNDKAHQNTPLAMAAYGWKRTA